MEKPSAQSAYISLEQAAERVPYSAQYLGLRARQGKLKSVKIGRSWFTTEEWLKSYAKNVRTYRKKKRANPLFPKRLYDADARVNPLPDLSRLRPRISPEYHYEAVVSSRAMALLLAGYAIVISIFIFSPHSGEYRALMDRATEEYANLARVLFASSGAAAVDYVSQFGNVFKVP